MSTQAPRPGARKLGAALMPPRWLPVCRRPQVHPVIVRRRSSPPCPQVDATDFYVHQLRGGPHRLHDADRQLPAPAGRNGGPNYFGLSIPTRSTRFTLVNDGARSKTSPVQTQNTPRRQQVVGRRQADLHTARTERLRRRRDARFARVKRARNLHPERHLRPAAHGNGNAGDEHHPRNDDLRQAGR